MKKWYVLHSKPNKEDFVLQQLLTHSVDAYCPFIKVDPVNPRSRNVRPYFPGYLFVSANLDVTGVSILKWIPGTLGLIDFGDELASIPDDLLQAIRSHVDQLNGEDRIKNAKFVAGNSVMIRTGPLSGHQGIFDSYLSGLDRVRILLQVLQDERMKIDLPRVQIEHINIHQEYC
jgi:transcriptional antiterminator RfaH